jgi:hypothetical protein
MGDRDMKTGSAKLISGWITPIPAASYNAYLATFSQVSRNSTFVLTNSNQAIAMDHLPLPGSSTTANATFRLILNGSPPQNFSTLKDAIGKSVMLEPYNFPGMVVVVQKGLVLAVAAPPPPATAGSSAFQLVAGLDGRPETVSLESESNKGCFVYGGVNNNSSTIMNLKCQSGSKDANFNQAASFVMGQGLSEYHPISFVAKGARRNFLLQPLLSFQDEFYSVYFNIQA